MKYRGNIAFNFVLFFREIYVLSHIGRLMWNIKNDRASDSVCDVLLVKNRWILSLKFFLSLFPTDILYRNVCSNK